MVSERQQLLYPGDPVADAASFRELSQRFTVPTTASPETSTGWEHGNLVQYLLGRKAIMSTPARVIGSVQEEGRPDFAKRLSEAKRSATIHLPESDYALPEWAAHFGGAVLQIIEHEHATNPRADQQIAQLRFQH